MVNFIIFLIFFVLDLLKIKTLNVFIAIFVKTTNMLNSLKMLILKTLLDTFKHACSLISERDTIMAITHGVAGHLRR